MKMLDVLKDELHAVSDPRVVGRTRHLLIDILVIGVLGVTCHAETWEEISGFAKAREDWLRKFLELPNGLPSHDTISRVYALIDPKELELAFISWVKRSNSQKYFDEIKTIFNKEKEFNLEVCSVEESGHGRKEKRTISVIRKDQFPDNFNKNEKSEDHFLKLNAIGKVVYERELPETAPFIYEEGRRKVATNSVRYETETRYFITSLRRSPKALLNQLRLQWGIENQLHWSLDVNLGEDANKTRRN